MRNKEDRSGDSGYWRCQFAGWGGLGSIWLAGAVFAPTFRPLDILWALAFSTCGLLASHLIKLRLARLNPAELGEPAIIRTCVWLCLALGGTVALAVNGIRWLLYPTEFATVERLPMTLMVSAGVSAGVLGTWCAIYIGFKNREAARMAAAERTRLEAAMRAAQLEGLRAQMNPHFLFNSLNTVRALITTDPDSARDAVTLLADLLRATLTDSRQKLLPLRDELATARTYLALEKLRFRERLEVSEDVDPAALAFEVPGLLLQTLVENAVKHGIANRRDGGRIHIATEWRGEVLRVVVGNTGNVRPTLASAEGLSLGLSNSRERLRLHFGAASGLTLRQAAPNWVEAVASIPAPRSVPGGTRAATAIA
jgi:two-component sensor histidine kinase